MSATGSTRSEIVTRLATIEDAEVIRAIYNHEVENHTTTLDLIPRSLEAQREWITQRSGAFSAVVAATRATPNSVVGFASMSPYRERAAYSTTVEDSVYVARDHAGQGIGRALMDELVDTARGSGFHSMVARIEASGEASRALHRACGFELIGVERQVGRKFGRWLDMAIMQLML